MPDDHTTQQHHTPTPPPEDFASAHATQHPILTFDVEHYRKLITDAKLTKAEEEVLLSAIWQVVVALVDFGFGLHPVQQLPERKMLEQDSGVVLDSINNSFDDTTTFAARAFEPAAGGSDS